MRRMAMAALSAVGIAAAAGQVNAQQTIFNLDLIGSDTEGGQCKVVFDAQNRLGFDIAQAQFEVYILDPARQFKGSYALSLPAIQTGKRKILKFSLPPPCDQIGRLVSNGFTSCTGDDGADRLKDCADGLRMSSTRPIPFNDDAD